MAGARPSLPPGQGRGADRDLGRERTPECSGTLYQGQSLAEPQKGCTTPWMPRLAPALPQVLREGVKGWNPPSPGSRVTLFLLAEQRAPGETRGRPLGFWSRGCQGFEARYTPTEKEMIAARKGIEPICIAGVTGGSQQLTVLEAEVSLTGNEWQKHPVVTGPEAPRILGMLKLTRHPRKNRASLQR